MRFGELIRKYRHDKGLTLEAVARRIGSHKGYVSGIENGKVNPPSWKVVRRMARLFGADELFFQILAWTEKAPKVCREEVLKMVGPWMFKIEMRAPTEPPKTDAAKARCACTIQADGKIGVACALHHGLEERATEAAANTCDEIAARLPEGPGHEAAKECAQGVRDHCDPGLCGGGEGIV